jgi:hypothetical protein
VLLVRIARITSCFFQIRLLGFFQIGLMGFFQMGLMGALLIAK